MIKLLTSICLIASLSMADNFIQTKPKDPKPQLPKLTKEDKAFKNEMSKYPKGTAFFINGKTGKIISATKNAIPKAKSNKPKQSKTYKRVKKSNETIPYNITEEKINIM